MICSVPPGVSVVIPTYQRRELVGRAVASVLGQGFSDFELIVVDDGSTDGTAEALRGLDQRLRCHRRPHRGAAAARNAGIRLARAPIVAFLDSDDRWLSDHLAGVTEALDRHPQAVLVTTAPRFAVAGRARPSEARLVDALPCALFECYGGYPSGVAARRGRLLACGGFDDRLVVMEDCDLWLRMAALGPFCVLQRRTIVRQDTRGSLVHRGIASGKYLEAEERIARTALSVVARSQRPDREELARRAEGRAEFVKALRALAEGDDDDAATALENACRLLPDLGEMQDFVTRRIVKIASSPQERFRVVAMASALWPDQRSDTALHLRWKAISLAPRRRVGPALGLLAGTPLPRLPAYVVRSRSRWLRTLRRRAQSVRYRGKESPELAAGA
jgi:hypothetical protein